MLHKITEEKTLTAKSLVKLLQGVKTTFPNLGLLLENLQKLADWSSATGIDLLLILDWNYSLVVPGYKIPFWLHIGEIR